MRYRLAIIQSHPIQYFSPLFRALARRPEVELKVLYCLRPTPEQQGSGFGVEFEWDVPLLDGYDSEFLANRARRPELSFWGCDTPGVAELVRNAGYDAWLVPGWNLRSYWQTMRACWRMKVPMMIRSEANLLDRRPMHVRLLKRLILGRWLPRFAAYLTIGKLNAEFYRVFGADPTRFFASPYCVNNDFFAHEFQRWSTRRPELRARWGIAEDTTAFLFCGKLIDKKRPTDAIAAAGRLTATGLKVHLLIVGDGPLRSACEAAVRRKHIPVTFAGFLNQRELPRAYVACDALVLPSGYAETWGLVVNEAMSCGVPAVVSDRVGCGPDLVADGVTGWRYPSGDVSALADRMKRLATNRALLLELGASAQRRVSTYSIDAAVEGVLKALTSVKSEAALRA